LGEEAEMAEIHEKVEVKVGEIEKEIPEEEMFVFWKCNSHFSRGFPRLFRIVVGLNLLEFLVLNLRVLG
jgi:hypothetical protein